MTNLFRNSTLFHPLSCTPAKTHHGMHNARILRHSTYQDTIKPLFVHENYSQLSYAKQFQIIEPLLTLSTPTITKYHMGNNRGKQQYV